MKVEDEVAIDFLDGDAILWQFGFELRSGERQAA
jgi:hypothetical protein